MSERYIVREMDTCWGIRYGVFDTVNRSWPALMFGRVISNSVPNREKCERDAAWLNEQRVDQVRTERGD
jgi:hypothetical protein